MAEFFVEDETTTCLRRAEISLQNEQTELEARDSVTFIDLSYHRSSKAKSNAAAPGTEFEDDNFGSVVPEVKKSSNVEVVGEKVGACMLHVFVLPSQVVEDLEKYMDSVQTRITSIKDMRKFLEGPDVPEHRDYKEFLAFKTLPGIACRGLRARWKPAKQSLKSPTRSWP